MDRTMPVHVQVTKYRDRHGLSLVCRAVRTVHTPKGYYVMTVVNYNANGGIFHFSKPRLFNEKESRLSIWKNSTCSFRVPFFRFIDASCYVINKARLVLWYFVARSSCTLILSKPCPVAVQPVPLLRLHCTCVYLQNCVLLYLCVIVPVCYCILV